MSADPGWLNSLRSVVDRAVARRWLHEPGGEIRLLRIAEACLSSPRGRGRPNKTPSSVPAYGRLLQRAATLWITTADPMSFGETAGVVATKALGNSGLPPAERNLLPGTVDALRRLLRVSLENGSVAFWDEVERATIERGEVVVRNPVDGVGRQAQLKRLNRRLSAFEAPIRRLNYWLSVHRGAGSQTLANIFRAVDALDEMPISEAIRYFGDCANAWAEDHPVKQGGADNPN